VNILERALLEKLGRENGWENILESRDERVVLGSARHRGRATVVSSHGTTGWSIEFPEQRLVRELDRTLPGLIQGASAFSALDMNTLAALLHRAAELSLSLPDQAARIFCERSRVALAAITAEGTEVERMVRQRVGQDVFRDALVEYWGGACAVTSLALPEVLRASHAKPWATCDTDEERLDVFNGFLLVAHLDALFDRGLITFDLNGMLIVSEQLNSSHRTQLHLNELMRLRWIAPEHHPYLEWHRANEFK
jgi:putative restriction endonuclease